MGPRCSIDPSLTLFSLHKDMHRSKTFHSGPRQNLQINCHESKLLTAQLCFHPLPTIITVSAAAPLLWQESLPLEYLFAAPFLSIFRIYDSRKAQNYLHWLWISLISSHIKKKTGKEFYWNFFFVFVWQKRCYEEYEICFHSSICISTLTTGLAMIQVAQSQYNNLNRVIHQQKNWWRLISFEL